MGVVLVADRGRRRARGRARSKGNGSRNGKGGRGGGRAQAKQAWEVHGGKQESETDKRQEKAQRKIWRET